MPSRLARVICVANSYRTLVRLSPSFSAGIIGQVVRVVSFGGDGRAFDVVHNGSDAAVAETAAVQLAKPSAGCRSHRPTTATTGSQSPIVALSH